MGNNMRGIVMGERSVIALGAGDKTETRRTMSVQRELGRVWRWGAVDRRGVHTGIEVGGPHPRYIMSRCVHGVAGDTLYVRESYKAAYRRNRDGALQVIYRADGRMVYLVEPKGTVARLGDYWRSGRFMFRFMARYWLRVVSVTPEPLHAITEEAARREGIFNHGGLWYAPGGDSGHDSPVEAYRAWWDLLHGGDPASEWAANPEVWAIRFEVERTDPYHLAEG